MPKLLLAVAGLLWFASPSLAVDAFDRHTDFWLRLAAKRGEPLTEMSSGQAARLKRLGPGIVSPCVVVQTDSGAWTKALLSWGFRKAEPKPIPVLLIERYVTYDRDRRNVAVARGKDVMLFPGFQFDFDIGQVVPAGVGGDVAFDAKRRLIGLEGAKLYGLNGPTLPPAGAGEKYDPNDHVGVKPADFAGNWRVDADGRWKGVWQISIDDEGNVQGQYLSDETQSTFPLRGKIASTELPHRLVFEVEFAAATQRYEMYIWTTDKSAMAGTTTLIDRKFGVYAVREKK